MTSKANDKSTELMEAYNQAISSTFAAADAGIAQGTAAVKVLSEAAEAERQVLGKLAAQAADNARARSENLTAAMQGMMTPSFPDSAEAKESIGKIIEGEMSFYQSMSKSWMDYMAGLESRRNAAAQAIIESSASTIESGQAAVNSAAKYGQAFFDWSMSAAPVTNDAKRTNS